MSKPGLNPDYLPPRAQALAALIGLPGLLQLVEYRGGRRLKIPAEVHKDHPLCSLIGLNALTALVGVYGGDEIDIPLLHAAKRQLIWADIRRCRTEGQTVASLAERYQMTERGIYKIQQRVADDDRQEDLEF
ncbi:MAG: Mor transcription activator family protein [Candidatus Sedimenticola sp. (ex Thyasira tokunagai)]